MKQKYKLDFARLSAEIVFNFMLNQLETHLLSDLGYLTVQGTLDIAILSIFTNNGKFLQQRVSKIHRKGLTVCAVSNDLEFGIIQVVMEIQTRYQSTFSELSINKHLEKKLIS